MRKILEETLFDIRKNMVLFIVMTLQFTVCFYICIFSEQLRYEIAFLKEEVLGKKLEYKYYDITDNLVGSYENEFFEKEDALGRLKIMYSMLKNNDNFNYLEIYENPVVIIGDNIGDKLIYRYEQGETDIYRGTENGQTLNEVKCYWISSNVGEAFDFRYREGSLWSEQESNNDVIPILLGYDYIGIYNVGDTISGITPIDGRIRFEVCGILEEGSYLVNNDRMINLDRYVLLPLQDAGTVPESAEEERAQRILYLLKINGTLQSNLSADELQQIVTEICNSSGVTPISSVLGATNVQSYIMRDSLENILEMIENMLLVLVIFSIFTALFYVLIKIDKNKRYYAILSINGFSMSQIKSIILGNILFPIIAADLAAGLIACLISFILNFQSLPLGKLIGINASLVLLAFVTGCIKLKYFDVALHIGGEK